MPEDKAFHEKAHRLVDSGHGPTIKYLVALGTPSWDSERRTAVVIVMQYDGKPNWKMPAHVLTDDLPSVLSAITELQGATGVR